MCILKLIIVNIGIKSPLSDSTITIHTCPYRSPLPLPLPSFPTPLKDLTLTEGVIRIIGLSILHMLPCTTTKGLTRCIIVGDYVVDD